MKVSKKLIEVALPLEAINKASAREKSIRHGHPSTLHLWWARRPLAAARAVIFAQMVDDPSEYVDTLLSDKRLRNRAEATLKARRKRWFEATDLAKKAKKAGIEAPAPGEEPSLREVAAELERERLFGIIEDLVQWENTTNEKVLDAARAEIWQSWRRSCAQNADHPRAQQLFDRQTLPAFHDPFAGGGALPLEAQRLGMSAYASDLNPVAVLINKAMIEIPPRFAELAPVNPKVRADQSLLANKWRGAQGLAEDVRYYGQWIRNEAQAQIGHLYPTVEVTPEMAKGRSDLKPYIGQGLKVIAWLWARTVNSPNPAFGSVAIPLISTFILSSRPGREAYLEPVIEGKSYRFTVKAGKPRNAAAALGTTAGRRNAFRCLMSDVPVSYEHIRKEGKSARMGARLIAIVAEGPKGRLYLSPTKEQEAAALSATPEWRPELALPENPRDFKTPNYGLPTFGDLFTSRQLVALTTFSRLVTDAAARIHKDATAAGMSDDGIPLRDGGHGATAYAEAVAVYLSFSVDKGANYWSSLCSWHGERDTITSTFGRQALPMVWDYAEGNPFSDSSGNISAGFDQAARSLDAAPARPTGIAIHADAAGQSITSDKVVSTDPPYYDNIGYADLSDFFYVWMRRSLRTIFPDLFATVAVPKSQELVATPYRHGGKDQAESFFLSGMTEAMRRLALQAHPGFPVTIYYAFKQSESDRDSGTSSTGWETFLAAVIRAGFAISGTWPVRTEYTGNLKKNMSALASSIILVCQRRPAESPKATRAQFRAALKGELPTAVRHLQEGNIAPVDLAQAAIGPGMAIYTRYAAVQDTTGQTIPVRDALVLINETLDETLAEQESDFDSDSRWAITWFEEHGFAEGEYGRAEQLTKSKNTSVTGLTEAGIILHRRSKVRLLMPAELPADWDPASDRRLTSWESVHHLVRVLNDSGERAAADLVLKLGSKAEAARELAYRLYAICERKKRPAEALSYNSLVQSWPELVRLAREGATATAGDLFAIDDEV